MKPKVGSFKKSTNGQTFNWTTQGKKERNHKLLNSGVKKVTLLQCYKNLKDCERIYKKNNSKKIRQMI